MRNRRGALLVILTTASMLPPDEPAGSPPYLSPANGRARCPQPLNAAEARHGAILGSALWSI
jgi:hypothetical protein